MIRFTWPVQGTVSRGWAYLSSIYVNGQHAAIDVPGATGTPIRAIAAGVVKGFGWDMYSGFFVAVTHAGGWTSYYRHLYGQAPVVVGQRVAQGEIIGNLGSTGYSTGPHLHFDLWSDSPVVGAFRKHGIWAVDPELYLGVEEENSMDQSTFNRMYTKAVEEVGFPSRDEKTKKPTSRFHTLAAWLDLFRRHGEDVSKHSASEEHDHGIPAGRTGKA